jgi:hypothetical protein
MSTPAGRRTTADGKDVPGLVGLRLQLVARATDLRLVVDD